MIKTIKVEKQMHIGELLEYVRKNELKGRYFRVMNESRYIKITPYGDIYFDLDFCFRPDDTFTVEVEEPITEDTRIPKTVTLTENEEACRSWNNSINGLKRAYPGALQIHAIVNGKLQLIWEAE